MATSTVPMISHDERPVARYNMPNTVLNSSNAGPKSFSPAMMSSATAHTPKIGAKSRNRGKTKPKKRAPATWNNARLFTRSWAKNSSRRILENSPGCRENGPMEIQSFASALVPLGHTIGSASSTKPTKPSKKE